MVTLRDAREEYTRYRRKYFADTVPEPICVIFKWAKIPGLYGATQRVQVGDGYIYTVELSRRLRPHPKLFTAVLLHEMLHMSRWKMTHGPAWREEVMKLAQLGILDEFF